MSSWRVPKDGDKVLMDENKEFMDDEEGEIIDSPTMRPSLPLGLK
jgi:hypothetical protein